MSIVLVLMAGPRIVDADGGATGGAALGTVDPAMEAKSLAKLTRALDSACSKVPCPNPQLPFPIQAAGDQIGPDYAQLDYPVWEEPQGISAFNWCGPGSTSGVVSRWATMSGYMDPVPNWSGGKDGYMTYLARTLGELETCCDGSICYECTTFDGMVRVTNAQTNNYVTSSWLRDWYVLSHRIHDVDQFKAMLWLDVHDVAVPLIPAVDTYQLPGWGFKSIAHWVHVRQFWYGGDTLTYGDPAGRDQGSTETYGWHVVPLTSFYLDHIRSLYNRVVW